jgi:hypothetical protein
VKARLAVLGALVTLAVTLGSASPAGAGGSQWTFDQPSYLPGEVATARGDFGPGCCDRGWLDDGPYLAWITPYPADGELPDREALLVGDVRLTQEPIRFGDQTSFVNVATVVFVVPDVRPGPYVLLHCNDPCTAPLGDLVQGLLWIGSAGDLAALTPTSTTSSTTTIPPSTTTTTTTPPRPEPPTSTSTTAPVVAGGLVATAGVATAGALGWRRRHRR